MEVELIRQYTLIVDFLGHVLGPDYEIALHELEDDSNRIIAIANGELTGRHIGSPLSNKMLEFVAGNLYETQNYVLNFVRVRHGQDHVLQLHVHQGTARGAVRPAVHQL